MARGLAEIATANNLSELIVDTKDTTLTIRRGPVAQVGQVGQVGQIGQVGQVMMPMPQMPVATHAPHVTAPTSALAPTAAPIVDDKSHVVTSPFVGTFYRKPNPDSANYVSMGDKVEKGAALCIVEAMKLMNEIEADAAGTITGILVEDGSSVEYGQPLFKITV